MAVRMDDETGRDLMGEGPKPKPQPRVAMGTPGGDLMAMPQMPAARMVVPGVMKEGISMPAGGMPRPPQQPRAQQFNMEEQLRMAIAADIASGDPMRIQRAMDAMRSLYMEPEPTPAKGK